MKQPVDFLTGHANQWYVDVADALIHDGQPVVSRGRAVHEALHTVLRMDHPRRRVLTVPFRRANPFFQAAETVWILAGRADAQWILPYNRQLGQFLDTAVPRPGYFHGAYGERLRRWGHISQLDEDASDGTVDQLRHVLDQLRKDPGSRRAVAVLHNPMVDNPWVDSLDRPCNIALTVQQRDGQLHMAVFNRSNDLTLGLAYTNIVQFTTIQEFLAAGLGLEPGMYTHVSSSLHVYDDDQIARRCIAQQQYRFDVYDHAAPARMCPWGTAGEGFDVVESLTAKTTAPLACPYWESVRTLLVVWGRLRAVAESHDPLLLTVAVETSAEILLGMAAKDWMVAALEFVHRWARKRGVEKQFEATVRGRPDDLLPEPALRFITHDQYAAAEQA